MKPMLMNSSILGHRRGFSLVELLVVIAIIAVLIALVIVSVGSFQSSARLTQCMSNQHQLQIGLVSWSQDNKGKFMSPNSTYYPPGASNPNRDLFWVKSYNNGVGSGEVRLDSNNAETEQALRDGALWEYIGDEKTYRSPLDKTGRVRSYALNGFISDLPDTSTNPATSWGPTVDRISKIRNPSNTFYTIPEEDPGSPFNRGGWVIDLNGNGGIRWKDIPAFWTDDGRYALSFIDGSSRVAQVINPDLPSILTQNELPVTPDTSDDFDQLAKWLDPTR
ncbi:MAG: hypothetical protein CMJ67_04150 [Planctomycetaceae bacterium]|nr:hypothetical protein [Planctomycetaceae bacterium]